MLRYFAIYSSTIGFPELAYPPLLRVRLLVVYFSSSSYSNFTGVLEFQCMHVFITTQLRKVGKSVPYSWLRHQLKQLIEKVDHSSIISDARHPYLPPQVQVVSSEVTKLRAAVDFSPKDSEQVVSESYSSVPVAWRCGASRLGATLFSLPGLHKAR